MILAKSIQEFIENCETQEEEILLLREIILSTELVETIKWGIPVYTINKKNVVGIGAFKAYVGCWFYQGVFLKDKKKKLINANKEKTKALRQWRFNSKEEIIKEAKNIKAYLEEAIQNQKEGKEIKPSKNKPIVIPVELKNALDANQKLKQSFEIFSKMKKREFAEYISDAKRAATKESRLEKIKPMILNGVGLNDKYRK